MKNFSQLDGRHIKFIEDQNLFFVATSSLKENTKVNLSPKGYDTFRILDGKTVCYLDLSGSGAETIAHVHENGRITIMFCAFDGPPQILRIYGKARVIRYDDEEFKCFTDIFDTSIGERGIVYVDIDLVKTSCGFSVPIMKHISDRTQLNRFYESKGRDWIVNYEHSKNAKSIDNLPSPMGLDYD